MKMQTFEEYLIEAKKKKATAGEKHRDPKFGRFSDEEAVSIMFQFVKKKYSNKKITDEQLRKEVEVAKNNSKHPLNVANQSEQRQTAFVGGKWTEISEPSYYDRLADSTEAIVDMSENPELNKYLDRKGPWSLQTQGRATHDRGVTGLYGKSPATSKTDLAMVHNKTGEHGARFTAKQLGGAFLASSAPDDFGGIYSSIFHKWARDGKISSRMNQKHQDEVKQVKRNLRRGQRQAAQNTIDSWFKKYGEELYYKAGQEAGTGQTKFQRGPGESIAAVPDWGIYLGKPKRKGDTERYQRIVPSEHIKGQHPNVTLGKHPHAFARAQARAKITGKPSNIKPDPAVVRMETEAPPIKRDYQARTGKAEPEPTKTRRKAEPEPHPLQHSNRVPGSDMAFHGEHELAKLRATKTKVVSSKKPGVISKVKGKVAVAFKKSFKSALPKGKTRQPSVKEPTKKFDWEKVKSDFENPRNKVSDIAAKHKYDTSTIYRQARERNWEVKNA